MMYDAFHLRDCFQYCCSKHDADKAPANIIVFDKDWVPSMVDGYLKLLLEILFVRSGAEMSFEDELRLEILHILMANERESYSRIRQTVPFNGTHIEDATFERVLGEVSTFVAPDQSSFFNQQGYYVLKPECWIQMVDMIRCRFRAKDQREFNKIGLRMEKALMQSLPNTQDQRKPWFYLCLPDFNADVECINTYKLLLQPSNIFVCRFAIEWVRHVYSLDVN